MKVLILGAGYGTRLARDLAKTDQYTELRGVPKPLLPIAGKPLISHWMDIINSCQYTKGSEVYIVVSLLDRMQKHVKGGGADPCSIKSILVQRAHSNVIKDSFQYKSHILLLGAHSDAHPM